MMKKMIKMTQPDLFPDIKHPLLLSTLFYDNLVSLVIFACSNPLYLAYLLYFSPYILQLLSFLFPLLLLTSILLLPLPLHFTLEGDTSSASHLDQLHSLVVASIGNVFEWDDDTMHGGEVYVESLEQSELLEADVEGRERVDFKGSSFEPKNPSSSVYEKLDNGEDMEEFDFVDDGKSELSESDFGIADRVSLKGSSFEPENPIVIPGNLTKHGRSMGELDEILTPNCGIREDPAEFSSKNSQQIEVLESKTRTGDQVSLKGESFVPQTPDRTSEILISSSLNRKPGHDGGGQCLLRSRSMRTTGELYKHSGVNCEVFQDPNQEFLNKLLKSQSTKISFKSCSMRREEQECRGIQRDGSMRKEREWKRTLACKLYEERMSFKLREETIVDEGAEEMDSLWEAYEADANMSNKLKSKEKKGKREMHIEEEDEEDEEDEKEEEDEIAGKICCLQALRLSTGKMNLGVGRPNLVRISKAIKGFGFFRRSGSSRSRSG